MHYFFCSFIKAFSTFYHKISKKASKIINDLFFCESTDHFRVNPYSIWIYLIFQLMQTDANEKELSPYLTVSRINYVIFNKKVFKTLLFHDKMITKDIIKEELP